MLKLIDKLHHQQQGIFHQTAVMHVRATEFSLHAPILRFNADRSFVANEVSRITKDWSPSAVQRPVHLYDVVPSSCGTNAYMNQARVDQALSSLVFS